MTAVVSIKHPAPRFEGQTKTKLDNQDASKATAKVVGDEVVRYFDRNLEVLKSVLSCAEKAAKIRKTEEKEKQTCLQSRNILLIPTESWQTVKAAMLQNAKFYRGGRFCGGSAKRQETVISRRSCRFAVRF